jgi:hypothetical protein
VRRLKGQDQGVSDATRPTPHLLTAGIAVSVWSFGTVLLHYLIVYRTQLAVSGPTNTICNELWGAAGCFTRGRPVVVLSASILALIPALVAWFLLRSNRRKQASILLGAVVIAAGMAVVSLPPRCPEGAPLRVTENDENDRRWACISTIK